MDFISKFEQEDRERTRVRINADEQAAQQRIEASGRFRQVLDCLQPILKSKVAYIKSRLGIQLELDIYGTAIAIIAPVSYRKSIDEGRTISVNGQTLVERPQFSCSVLISQDIGEGLRVVARVPPAASADQYEAMRKDFSCGDYSAYCGHSNEKFRHGYIEIDVRETLADLEMGDLDLLLEWVISHARGSSTRTPRLRGKQWRANSGNGANVGKSALGSAAGWCLALGILSFFTYLPGPFALIWGISIRNRLTKDGQKEGRGKAAWAIGLGAYSTCAMLVWLFMSFFGSSLGTPHP